jgi:putative membrane protein
MPARRLTVLTATALWFAVSPLASLHAQSEAALPKDSVQADRDVVRHAVAGSLMEVQLGQLAQRHATHDMVQKFGQRMAMDHQKLQDQWTDLAAKHGMPIKPALSSKQQRKVDRLQHADRAVFDREYMIVMIKAHTKDAAALKAAVDSARSEPVRKMAAYALPIVQDHLLAARAAAKDVGVDSAVVAQSERVAESQ